MRGPRMVYSAEELDFIKARAHEPRHLIVAAFSAAFGRHDVTTAHITGLCKRMKWSRTHRFTPEEDAIIKAEYADTLTAVLAERLGRPLLAVNKRAAKLGVKKSAAFHESEQSGRLRKGDPRGAATRFVAGNPSPNKGKKRGRGWAPGRMAESQFRKGQRSRTWTPVGSTRIRDGYEFTKVSDVPNVSHTVNWRQTHVIRWEAVHGPVPVGHSLKCLDGNRLNTYPANWECVPRGVIPRLNGGPHKKRLAYDAAPAELKPTVMVIAKLEHAITQRRKVPA